MDASERDRRHRRAHDLLEPLSAKGVVGIAATFTDHAGVTRTKTVPLDRLPELAAWGVGATPAFDVFGFDDSIAVAADGSTPVGDLRVMPDMDRVVPLVTYPGWAWTPSNRHWQSGESHPACSRSLLRRLTDGLATQGVTMRAAFEIEWVVSSGDGDEFVAATSGPGYSLHRLGEVSAYARRVLEALADEGVQVEQFHPEYGPGQFELSVAAEDPVTAADTSVLVRETIRGVGHEYGLRTSYSPKVALGGVGSGGHVHLSLWRDGENLMSSGQGPCSMTADAEAFTAGVLEHLPALMAIGAPALVSYLRLIPSVWASAYRCWGAENREAPLRVITGSAGTEATTSNLEVKCFDLLANPYLVLAGLIAAGRSAIADGARLPDPVDVDPAALSATEHQSRGIDRLPTSLESSTALFEADRVLGEAFGPQLREAVLAVRRAEMSAYADATDEQIAAAARWVH